MGGCTSKRKRSKKGNRTAANGGTTTNEGNAANQGTAANGGSTTNQANATNEGNAANQGTAANEGTEDDEGTADNEGTTTNQGAAANEGTTTNQRAAANEGTTTNQGTAANRGTTTNQGTAANRGTTTNQGTAANRGTTTNQGTAAIRGTTTNRGNIAGTSKASLAKPVSPSSSPSGRRLMQELREIETQPPPLCTAGLDNDNLYTWKASIIGPPDSPYEGGVFHLKMMFTRDYPFKPPRVTFTTRIYHCNITSKGGEICLDILRKEGWSSASTVSALLVSICSLLSDCNPHSPLEGPIGKLYLENRDKHDEKAREWTKKYATPS